MPTKYAGLDRPIGLSVVPGGAIGAIPVDGNLETGDTLLEVRHISADLVTNASILAESSISGFNEITTTTTDTTGNFIVVVFAKPN